MLDVLARVSAAIDYVDRQYGGRDARTWTAVRVRVLSKNASDIVVCLDVGPRWPDGSRERRSASVHFNADGTITSYAHA